MNKSEAIKLLQDAIDKLNETFKPNTHTVDGINMVWSRIHGIEYGLSVVEKIDSEEDMPEIPDYIENWYMENQDYLEQAIYDIHAEIDKKPSVELSQTQLWFNNTEVNPIETIMTLKRLGYKPKEKTFYALIKGHELVETEPVLDDDTGKDVSEWSRNVHFVQQQNGQIVVDMKDTGLTGAKEFMTMDEWNELGINDDNADFVEVAE